MARNVVAPGRVDPQAARRAFSFRLVGEIVSELRRVTWPTRQETMRLSLMVISVAVAIGIFLGFIVDPTFSLILEILLGN